jgi:hydrogenase/urease accessory protein HupE
VTLARALVVVALAASGASAHALSPSLLELVEAPDHTVAVRWSEPAGAPAALPLTPRLPAACRPLDRPEVSHDAQQLTLRWRADCSPGGLVGGTIGVDGLAARGTPALVRVVLADGRTIQRALAPGDAPFTIAARPGPLDVLRDYGGLGVEHILTGYDHLAFVLALVLLVHGARRLTTTVTAFTFGHSITLALAVLGIVHVPPAPVEVLIAASILLLAVELAQPPDAPADLVHRRPWLVAAGFGLLHGLGFAGALAQVGLPQGDIPLALLAFNLGIEAGQLAWVLVVIAVRAVVERVPVPARLGWVPAYAIGTLAAYWMLQRILDAL